MKQAYLIVDMSNDFVHESGNLPAVAAQNIVDHVYNRALEFIKNEDLVVVCMDNHQVNDDHFKLWPAHNVVGTWGVELYGRLNDLYQEYQDKIIYLPKAEYNAFYQTDLEKILKDHQVDEVVVSGVCTDICVYNTVYGAYLAGLKTVVYDQEVATFTANQKTFLDMMNITFKTEIR